MNSRVKQLEILPAIDIRGGRTVRLVQGALDKESSYGDPLESALAFQRDGAQWIHLVDLDAAFGSGNNAEIVANVIGKLDIKVAVSGGIRDDASLQTALLSGSARVNLGTAALENPEWTSRVIQEYGERIAVGLDVRGETLAARGWVKEGGNLYETLERLERDGCARYVLTDITRDGTLTGPNLELMRKVANLTNKPIIASGGISQLHDIASLCELTAIGVEGVIVGKALYAGRFTLKEALNLASERTDNGKV